MTERDKLIKELKIHVFHKQSCSLGTVDRDEGDFCSCDITKRRELLADFIIEDRKRIVGEIIKITVEQRDLYSGYSMTRKGTCNELIEQFNRLKNVDIYEDKDEIFY